MLWIILPMSVSAIHQISPEKAKQLQVRACTYDQEPVHKETMLYFPVSSVKYCVSLKTSKNVLHLARDRQRTTYIQPTVSVVLHEIGSPYRCRVDYMGYGGEYRLSPDLGYYVHCQKSISKYINDLVGSEVVPAWNSTNPSCPIQALPNSYRDYLTCDIGPRWYELFYTSAIRYEVFEDKTYHQFWANHSTVFIFKPGNYLEENGTEVDWLQKLVQLEARLKNCERVRYLIRVDNEWPLPITVFVDYRLRDNRYIKYLRHVGNGTLDQWYTGSFPIMHSDRAHEICVQLVWRGSANRFRLCRTFARPGECGFGSNSAIRRTTSGTGRLLLLLPLTAALLLSSLKS